LGDRNGVPPYSDYTGYVPVNDAMDMAAPFDPATVRDPDRWQPLRYADAAGATVTPGFLAPHWHLVTPFALPSGSLLRSPVGSATDESARYVAQAAEVLAQSAGLDDRAKAVVEYWADGPRSEQPPGHWWLLGQAVSRRDGHDLDRDVFLFCALGNALLDAGIVAWDSKRAADSCRPVTAVRHLFAGRPMRAWAGPFQGTGTIDGAPLAPLPAGHVPLAPFSEYTSGHSTFSAAAAEVLRLVTGATAAA
jgi:hypothetical protein